MPLFEREVQSLQVLLIASEGVPFVKTGGLADVVGSLPAALAQKGLQVAVMLPDYGDIPAVYKMEMEPVKEFTVPVGWRQQGCTLKKLSREGLTLYFIHNDYYFGRSGLYGFLDEAERFAFYCQAALTSLPYLDWMPDILHCHDWQTGLICYYVEKLRDNSEQFRKLSTLFTIHNLRYQGIFPREVLKDVLGLDNEDFSQDNLEFYNQVNFLKGGLVSADLITTVSRTYAAEILTASFGENMEGVLQQRAEELHGILNGIDYGEYNPRTDAALPFNFVHSLEKKRMNKIYIQEHLGLPRDKDVPLLAVISRLVREKVDLLTQVLPKLLTLDLQLVILGSGDDDYCGFFQHHAHQHSDKMAACLGFDEGLARKIYGASDIFLMPSLFEPCGLSQLIAMRYGSIPVVRETGGLKDTVIPFTSETGEGNGFTFQGFEGDDFFGSILEALNLYSDKEVWSKLVQNAVSSDYSWSNSAGEYISLYKGLLTKKRGI